MLHYFSHKKRKINLSEDFDISKLSIGIPVDNIKVDLPLKNIGDTFLPSPDYGVSNRKNVYGYSYPDKTKEKEYRVVNTISFYPYGNTNADKVYVDVERLCYPRIVVEPTAIELILFENEGKQYVIADLPKERTERIIITAINVFIEIFGECIMFSDEIKISDNLKRIRCNWEILPPGKWPREYTEHSNGKNNKNAKEFYYFRLTFIEDLKPKYAIKGSNGFAGYTAYMFKKICILESPEYGNATYFVEANRWEELSQKTKYELHQFNNLLAKVIHSSSWADSIREAFKKFEL